jgi:Cof subfamily protein (haloacid dehalogenase superfamily)
MKPRLVATDLDGTVVRSDRTISDRTVAAFARVERAGAMLVLVTGRPPRWMAPVADAVGHRGVAICANGAIVYDLREERVIESHLIPVDTLRLAIARLREALPGLAFAVEYDDGPVYGNDYAVSEWDRVRGQRVAGFDELVSRPAAKLLARHSELDADALLGRAIGLVGDVVSPTHSNGHRLLEMSAHGVSKASTLAELCARQGIAPADVVAFGDMPNDLPMLRWAGRSYAVANAHPDVLAAVDATTTANDEDGVARVIEELFS